MKVRAGASLSLSTDKPNKLNYSYVELS